MNRDQDKERGGKRQTKVDDEIKTAIADYLDASWRQKYYKSNFLSLFSVFVYLSKLNFLC